MRVTCPGSERPPKGAPATISGYTKPRGFCPECDGLYTIRLDGTVIVHKRDR